MVSSAVGAWKMEQKYVNSMNTKAPSMGSVSPWLEGRKSGTRPLDDVEWDLSPIQRTVLQDCGILQDLPVFKYFVDIPDPWHALQWMRVVTISLPARPMDELLAGLWKPDREFIGLRATPHRWLTWSYVTANIIFFKFWDGPYSHLLYFLGIGRLSLQR